MKFLSIVLLFLTSQVYAEAIGCKDCKYLAQIRISNKGLEKVIEKAVEANTERIRHEILKKGILKDQKWSPDSTCLEKAKKNSRELSMEECPYIPDFESDTGAFSLKDKNLFSSSFTNGKLNDINLNLKKPVHCDQLKCHIKIEVHQLDVSGKLNVQTLNNNKKIIPGKNISLSIPKGAEPILYEFDVAINPTTRLLEDVSKVNPDTVQVHIPERAIDFKIDEKAFANQEAQRTAELNELYQKTKHIVAEYKNTQTLDEEIRYAQTVRYHELNSKNKSKVQTQKINPVVSDKNRLKIEAQAEMEISETKIKKAIRTVQLPDTSDPKEQAKILSQMPTELFTLPKMSTALEHTETAARAKLNNYPDTGSYVMAKNAEGLANIGSYIPGVAEGVLFRFQDRLSDITDQINYHLKLMPQFADDIARLPKIAAQAISDLEHINAKMIPLKQKAANKSASKSELAELEKLNLQYLEARKKLSSNENWIKLYDKIIIERIENANHAVKLSVYPEQTNCIPQYLPASENDKNADYDIATEVSLEGFNHYIGRLHKNGDLNFCSEPLVAGKCKNGHRLVFQDQPTITFDKSTGLHKVRAKAKVDSLGSVTTEFDVKLKVCGTSPCLELIDPKAKSSNFILKIAGAGYMAEDAIRSANPALNEEDTMNVPIADLKALDIDKNNGAVNFQWNLK